MNPNDIQHNQRDSNGGLSNYIQWYLSEPIVVHKIQLQKRWNPANGGNEMKFNVIQ